MAEYEQDILREHTYDGIEEYDNKLPLWWQAIFYITVLAAFLYVGHYHFGPGKVGEEAWHAEQKELLEAALSSGGGLPDESTLRQLMTDQARITAGQESYLNGAGKCVSCHQKDLYGSVGPNLLDDYWLHGSDLSDIISTIADGRNGNQMPAQGMILSQDEIINLALYIATKNKQTPDANGKGIRKDGEVSQPITY